MNLQTAAQNRSGCAHDQACHTAYGASAAGADGSAARTASKKRIIANFIAKTLKWLLLSSDLQ
jgi:hypothetical protein